MTGDAVIPSGAMTLRAGLGTGVALVYGPFIWVAMSLAVIPALAHRDVPVNTRWWIQLTGHFLFVGLPMMMAMRTLLPAATGE